MSNQKRGRQIYLSNFEIGGLLIVTIMTVSNMYHASTNYLQATTALVSTEQKIVIKATRLQVYFRTNFELYS